MDKVIFMGTGEPGLDALMREIFQRRHPQENLRVSD